MPLPRLQAGKRLLGIALHRRPVVAHLLCSRQISLTQKAGIVQTLPPRRPAAPRVAQFHATSVAGSKKDPYAVLGVPRDSSSSEIKKKYYQMAKKYHPDTNQGSPEAAQKFAEVSEAWEVLGDDARRQEYDQFGYSGPQQGGFGAGNPFAGFGGFQGFQGFQGQQMDSEDIFEQFFGTSQRRGGPPRPRRGQNMQVQVTIDFMEAVQGCDKPVEFSIQSPNGEIINRKVTAKIPAGIDSDMNLRVSQQGGAGSNGGPPGDLFVVVQVREHEVWQREGADVHMELSLSLTEAIFGKKILVPTLHGETTIKVPSGTQPGWRQVVRSQGIRRLDGGGYGDMVVHFNVAIPCSLTSRQQQLLREFEEEMAPPSSRNQSNQWFDKVAGRYSRK